MGIGLSESQFCIGIKGDDFVYVCVCVKFVMKFLIAKLEKKPIQFCHEIVSFGIVLRMSCKYIYMRKML